MGGMEVSFKECWGKCFARVDVFVFSALLAIAVFAESFRLAANYQGLDWQIRNTVFYIILALSGAVQLSGCVWGNRLVWFISLVITGFGFFQYGASNPLGAALMFLRLNFQIC